MTRDGDRVQVIFPVLMLGMASLVFVQSGKAEPLSPKAEPLSVQLKNGRATLKGTVGADEQYEYALTAKKGQWLMIEVVSNPQDAATFRIKDPKREETSLHHTKSVHQRRC